MGLVGSTTLPCPALNACAWARAIRAHRGQAPGRRVRLELGPTCAFEWLSARRELSSVVGVLRPHLVKPLDWKVVPVRRIDLQADDDTMLLDLPVDPPNRRGPVLQCQPFWNRRGPSSVLGIFSRSVRSAFQSAATRGIWAQTSRAASFATLSNPVIGPSRRRRRPMMSFRIGPQFTSKIVGVATCVTCFFASTTETMVSAMSLAISIESRASQ